MILIISPGAVITRLLTLSQEKESYMSIWEKENVRMNEPGGRYSLSSWHFSFERHLPVGRPEKDSQVASVQ